MLDVKRTTELSIWTQAFAGVVTLVGMFRTLPPKHGILTDLLKIETAVQVVELFFYVYFLRKLALDSVETMARTRYFDWVITTPIMLLSTAAYMEYESAGSVDLGDFVRSKKGVLAKIWMFNLVMLATGYLAETRLLDPAVALVAGSLAFAATFAILHKEFAEKSPAGRKLFAAMATVWGAYGVAFALPPAQKNHMFNALDIVSKNFFGVFLYLQVVNIKHDGGV